MNETSANGTSSLPSLEAVTPAVAETSHEGVPSPDSSSLFALLSPRKTEQSNTAQLFRNNVEATYTAQALDEVRNQLADIARSGNTGEQVLLTEQEALAFLQEHPQALPEGMTVTGLNEQQVKLVLKHTEFARLRYSAHQAMVDDTHRRGMTNPQPTAMEMRIGAYKEMLEPQVRDAILEMYRKGYETNNSGFTLNTAHRQTVGGYFTLNRKTIANLKSLGAEVIVDKGIHTRIEFEPETANFEHIRTTWNLIASVLPDKGHPAPPATNGAAQLFRTVHSNIDLSIYPDLQQALDEFRQRAELLTYLDIPPEFSPQENEHAHVLAMKLLDKLRVEEKKETGVGSFEKDRKDKKTFFLSYLIFSSKTSSRKRNKVSVRVLKRSAPLSIIK